MTKSEFPDSKKRGNEHQLLLSDDFFESLADQINPWGPTCKKIKEIMKTFLNTVGKKRGID
jgi:hypothetical protein